MIRPLLLLASLLLLSGCSVNEKKENKFYGNIDVCTVSLAFRVSGRIESIGFDEGQRVRKGDVIARLDNALYLQALNQIDSQIKMQQATVEKLERGYRPEEIDKAASKLRQSEINRNRLKKEYERIEKLYSTSSVTPQQYDDAKAAYEAAEAEQSYAKSSYDMLRNGYDKEDILAAKASLEALQAQKELAKINLADTSLVSPTDGTVITRIYEAGSIVSPSQSVVEIAMDGEYWVRSYMSERYLGVIKTGLKALVHTDNGKTYEGTVSFISPIAEFTPKTVQTEELRTDLVYRFRIVLKEFDDSVRQGMPVTVTFPDVKFDTP